MDSSVIQHRLSVRGADYLLLAGVNDVNFQELAQVFNCRVVLRGDDLVLSGKLADVERAVPTVKRLVELARLGRSFGVEEIQRLADGTGNGASVSPATEGAPSDEGHLALRGARKTIMPKSAGQAAYLESMANNDIVVAIGPGGTGKTYLAVAKAVDALQKNQVKRIVLARPAVEAGERLGFLPGDFQEKVDPYLRPLWDALEDMMSADRLRRALEMRTVEIAPLAYMRGRTLADSFVILDEAQNATTAQMKMFLTRLGLNSYAVVTGDTTQIDLPNRCESGLLEAERILKNIDGIGFVYLHSIDVVRHRLVKDIVRAYAVAAEEPQE